jgi:hypothetical protein
MPPHQKFIFIFASLNVPTSKIQHACDDSLHNPISFHLYCISSFLANLGIILVLSPAPQPVMDGSARTLAGAA